MEMNENGDSQKGNAGRVKPQREVCPHYRILVVDDDAHIRELNAELLMSSGFHVDTAVDGAAAWDELSAQNYDLMITDNNMPRVSGVELLGKLHAARMELSVIMATGAMPEEEFNRQPWLQPAALLLKPYTLAELLETVKKVLRANADAWRQLVSPGIREELASGARMGLR